MERRQLARSIFAAGFGTALVSARAAAQSGANAARLSAAEIKAGVTPSDHAYPPLNVLRYGALGNGLADDTTAIRSAVAVAQIGGGVVFLPQGSYRISSTIEVGDHSNVYLRGAGSGTTVIVPAPGVEVALRFGAVTGAANQGFSDLSISCAEAPSCTGVHVFWANGFWADNFIIDQAGVGIRLSNGVIQYYSNWQINRSHTGGIYVSGGNDQYFHNGVMSNFGFIQPEFGIRIVESGGVWLTNLDLIAQGSGILLDPASGQSVDWLFAVNVACDTCCTAGIAVAPRGTGMVRGCDFTACWASSCSASGVQIGPGEAVGSINGVRFNGLRCQNNQQHGIVLGAGVGSPVNTSITNSDVSGNGAPIPAWTPTTQYSPGNLVTRGSETFRCSLAHTSAAGNAPPHSSNWIPFATGNYSGILVGAGVSGFSIQSNRIGQEDGYDLTQAYGVRVVAGRSDNYTITGNDVRGNKVAMLDGGSGATKIVRDNLGYNPVPQAAIAVGASPFTFMNTTGAPLVVYLQGGTVTSVATPDGLVVASATNVSVVVPHGSGLVVTYSGTPTMVCLGS